VRLVSASCLYDGRLVHVRHGAPSRTFRHRVYMWLVDLDELPALDRRLRGFGYDRRAPTTIRSADHLGPRGGDLKTNLLAYLDGHGIDLAGGRVDMLTNARVLGHVFNPLSVFYCHGPAGELRCVVAEVHNTYGERHAYLLQPDDRHACETGKAFYVSPFLAVGGEYRIVVPPPDERLSVQMRLQQAGAPVFQASLTGRRVPLSSPALWRAMARQPLMPARISALIRLHGLRLWARGAPRVARPVHPPQPGVGHPR
jgi:DUF1365 family protein